MLKPHHIRKSVLNNDTPHSTHTIIDVDLIIEQPVNAKKQFKKNDASKVVRIAFGEDKEAEIIDPFSFSITHII